MRARAWVLSALAMLSSASEAWTQTISFHDTTLLSTTWGIGSPLDVGDYDQDGYLDIVIAGNNGNPISKLYRNQGNGYFNDAFSSIDNLYAGGVHFGDYNNDGHLDFVIYGSSSNFDPGTSGGTPVVKLYKGNSTSSFTADTTLTGAALGNIVSSARWGDYNMDGKQDLLESGHVYKNLGGTGRTFATLGFLPDSSRQGISSWCDYDGDGDLDFMYMAGIDPNPPYNTPIYTQLWRNDGASFTHITTAVGGSDFPQIGQGAIAWGDYDNDGKPDVAICGANTGGRLTKIYKNNGNGNFVDIGAALTALYGTLAWGDFDNDGWLDLIAFGSNTSASYALSVYRNKRDGTFENLGRAGINTVSIGQVSVGDFNRDGKLDLALTGTNSANGLEPLEICRNITAVAANQAPSAPALVGSVAGVDSVRINWNRATDDKTPVMGLTYNLRMGTSSGAINTISPLADPSTGLRRVARAGNVWHDTSVVVRNLPNGTYYWAVQAIDHSFDGGPFSSEQSFSIGVPPLTPGTPSATINTITNISLSWSASAGTVTRYRIFRSMTSDSEFVQVDSTTSTSISHTLLQGGTYYFKIAAVNANGMSTLSSEEEVVTQASEPTSQPSNLVFSSVTSTQIMGSFSAAGAGGYIVIRKSGGFPAFVPADGSIYAVGSVVAAGEIVVAAGAPAGFVDSVLSPGTSYYYRIYAYNGSSFMTNYLTSAPLEGSRSTLNAEPTAAASSMTFLDVGTDSMRLQWNRAAGFPSGYLVLRRYDGAFGFTPTDGQSYTAGYASAGDTVVYAGADTAVIARGLAAGTISYFRVISFNGADITSNYLTSTTLDSYRTTLALEPTNQVSTISFSNVGATTLTVSVPAATGNPTGYLVVRDTNSAVTFTPMDGLAYTGGDSVALGEKVVYIGSTGSFSDGGLLPGQTYYYRAYAYNGAGEARNYLTLNPTLESVTTTADDQSPTITTAAIAVTQNFNTPVTITGNASDNVGIESVRLLYRRGNVSTFSQRVMVLKSGNSVSGTWEDTIPRSDVTGLGVIYRIVATDLAMRGDTTADMSFDVSLPANEITTQLSTKYSDGIPNSRKGSRTKGWYLFSIPMNLSSPKASDVLSDAFGTVNELWKIFNEDRKLVSESPLIINKGYWIKHLNNANKPVSLPSGTVLRLTSTTIPLSANKWQLIGNPFTVPAVIVNRPAELQGPVGWDGEKYVGESGNVTTPYNPIQVLDPFQAYWVNPGPSAVTLTVAPQSLGLSKRSTSRDANWWLQFSATVGELTDELNYIGTMSTPFYVTELPVLEEYVSLSFPYTDGDRTIDFVESNNKGQTWVMHVASNLDEKYATLTWQQHDLPKDFVVRILDVSSNAEVDIYSAQYRYRRAGRHEFRVFVGTETYTRSEFDKAVAELPSQFNLSQNYPNPFNPTTTIRYDLARAGQVSLVIYNLLGQKVHTLVGNQYQQTGRYTITWDGRNDAGAVVASGVYLYRLQAGNFVRTRKMLFLK